jgi:hypothetical protein
MEHKKLAPSWKPFTCRLGEAGIAKAILRAPTIKKLEAAGFASLLQVRFLLLLPWQNSAYETRCNERKCNLCTL